ncbi:EamA family transporter [Sulfobacillus thermosulfidooxidans]|uniref:EamA family transporter n=1 Tax=Sulfobacillus thermosulfidooxidans TaxID=28034 RepID=UPI0002D65F14|nr:EamA family transporter [Sulfobacillus thermosulfidooxidans]
MTTLEDMPQSILWIPYLVAFLSIVLSSTAQILLKILMRNHTVSLQLLSQPLFYAGFLAYGASAVLWLKVLAKLPLTVAYPLVSLNFILVAIGAAFFLHERISWQTFVGLALIFGGIVVISR